MIFRMKQNATGLANITLLATMAFVTVGTTVALYTGSANLVEMNFPQENNVKIELMDIQTSPDEARQTIREQFVPSGRSIP